MKAIFLRQSWFDSRCTKGSYLHLIGDFDHHGQCVVDDSDNMIILHPDHLISATVVADSFSCTRRAVLQDRIKATGAAEPPQVYGQILHEVFGQALKSNDWSTDHLRQIIEAILVNWMESLYEINTQVPQAVDYLMGKMPQLQAWASVFVNEDAFPHGEVLDRNGGVSKMNVNRLLELEEHIWSPLYGLKGNIDATVQVTLGEGDEHQGNKTLAVPLEFKTGKKDNNEMHRAQTQLYTLLLSDRYDINVTCGVLYYLETSRTFRIRAVRNEIRYMVMQRNELACYVRNKLELPPLVKKPFLCNTCYAQTACFTYHKLLDDGDGETSGLKEKFDQVVKHLKPSHRSFFQKWDELLTKEEREAMKFRRELWTMLSHEREALGRCFGQVFIEPGSAIETMDGPKINRYQYTFKKRAAAGTAFSFTESQLTIGEPIVVSDEKGHFALANGYITAVQPNRLSVAVDRRLDCNARERRAGFDEETNQVFNDVMEVTSGNTIRDVDVGSNPEGGAGEKTLYRVDKDEFSNGMATVRNNLIRMMEKDLFKARELRELIIEGRAPTFRASCSNFSLSHPSTQKDLNVDQVTAIDKVMRAQDYALVLGMPGTGKTTTIAQIIRALVAQNKSVLLTSYTHSAVDNILLKIKDDGIPILRLGAATKVHGEVQKFADLASVRKKSMAELDHSYVNSKVVASTCLGVNHAIFNTRIFDYCIVDEASQITLPTCLGPIRMAKTFILVGDHYQLPPLVQNKEAQQGGLDVSLFKLLSEQQPESVVSLEHQYRMAEDIMLLSNVLIYNGRLKCGTDTVANLMLDIPNLDAGLAAHHKAPPASATKTAHICVDDVPPPPHSPSPSFHSSCWLRQALNPSSRCLFLNTDSIRPSAHDVTKGARVVNPTEANLVAQLVLTLLSAQVPAHSIGIITFYRSQLALLRQTLHHHPSAAGVSHRRADGGESRRNFGLSAQEVEISTTDKFQGRDKDVVILSCVRSHRQDVDVVADDENGNDSSKVMTTPNSATAAGARSKLAAEIIPAEESSKNGSGGSSSSNNNVGDLLRDWRRVNVALTRAKSKLLIIGSKATLANSGDETWSGLVQLMDAGGGSTKTRTRSGKAEESREEGQQGGQSWVLDLPERAGEVGSGHEAAPGCGMHWFPDLYGGRGDDIISQLSPRKKHQQFSSSQFGIDIDIDIDIGTSKQQRQHHEHHHRRRPHHTAAPDELHSSTEQQQCNNNTTLFESNTQAQSTLSRAASQQPSHHHRRRRRHRHPAKQFHTSGIDLNVDTPSNTNSNSNSNSNSTARLAGKNLLTTTQMPKSNANNNKVNSSIITIAVDDDNNDDDNDVSSNKENKNKGCITITPSSLSPPHPHHHYYLPHH